MDRMVSMMSGAKKLLSDCLNIKENETLLIVADFPNEKVAKALFKAGREKKAEVTVVIMTPRTAHGEDPPKPVAEAMKFVDAAILATVFSLSHSNARKQATKAGTRIISIPGCKEEILIFGGIEADFLYLKPKVEKLGRLLSKARLINLTSHQGTDVNIKLCGRKSLNQTSIAHQRGAWTPSPIVETAVGPEEKGVDGVLVIDGVTIPGGQVKKPISVTFKRGRIVNIKGGQEARKFQKILQSFDHPNMYQVVEFGIGLNPNSRMGRGLMAEDESQFGTVHFGLGEGRSFGLPVLAPTHIDMVIRNPVLKIDGRLLLSDSQFHFGPFSAQNSK